MKVNDELMDKLATLSKLQFDEAEKEAIKKDLEKMTGFIEKLQEVDTENVAPLQFMSQNVNILRKDVAAAPMDSATATSNAQNATNEYFRVPKVISK